MKWDVGDFEADWGRRPGREWAVIVAIVLIHFAYLAAFFVPAISTPDANGYMAQARLIAREGRTGIVVESPAQYVGGHWMPTAPGVYYGQYPPGLPALLALVFGPLGPAASLWVMPVMASLTLLALFLIVGAWVGPGWGLLAAVLMAVNPKANEHALGADSHTAVCFFLMWGLYALVRWDRSRRPVWAALAGFCGGVIPGIRYPEALFLVGFGAFVLASVWREPGGWRSVVALGLGAAGPLAALAVRNQRAFGAFWKTGYSISGEQTAFSLGYFARYCVPYLVLLFVLGVALAFPMGVAGLRRLCRDARTRRHGLLLAGLIVPITMLYMAYYWGPGGHSMRFLLPTFFLYMIAAMWWLALEARERPARARKLAVVLVATTLLWGLPISTLSLLRLKRDNAVLDAVTRELARTVEPGSVVVADSGILQHLDFVGDWRLARVETALGQERAGPPGMPPVEAVEGPEARSEQAAAFRQDIERWAGSQRKVYWVASRDQIAAFRERLPVPDEFTTVAQLTLPAGGGPPGGPGEGSGRRPGQRDGGPGGPPPRPTLLGFALPFGPPGPPPGGGPGGPGGPGRPGGPPPGGGPPGGGGARAPRPDHFQPPQDGQLLIVRWKTPATA